MHTFDGKRSMEDGGLSYNFCLAAACAAAENILYSEFLIKGNV